MSTTTSTPAWRLLAEEARVRGFKNALSFRRWCKRVGVAIRKTGKMETVVPAEVDRAVLGDPAPSNDSAQAAAARGVAALFGEAG